MVTTRSTPHNQTDDQTNNLTGGQHDNVPGDNTGEVTANYLIDE